MNAEPGASTLSPEFLAWTKSVVGGKRSFDYLDRKVTLLAVRRLLAATGDDDPRWWSEDGPRPPAPPMFFYTGVDFGTWRSPDLSLVSRPSEQSLALWAGDRWTWIEPLHLGESFTSELEVTDIVRKPLSANKDAYELTETIRFSSEDGRLLAVQKRRTRCFERTGVPAAPAAVETKYSQEDVERLRAAYEAETARRQAASQLSWADVNLGDEVAPMVKGPVTMTNAMSFAAAWGSLMLPTDRLLWNWMTAKPGVTLTNSVVGGAPDTGLGMHWDPGVAHALGQPLPLDFGPRRIAWAAHMVSEWAGQEGRLLALDVKLLRPVYIGDVVWLTGEVSGKEPLSAKEGQVSCTLKGINQRGESVLIASAKAALPRL